MQNKWEFTKSSGQIKGISDGSIESFNRNILESLARETCQNSLDAAISDDPVEVFFDLEYIESCHFLGYNDYLNMIKKSKEFWSNNEKALNALEKADKTLHESKLPVLVIKDYNTKGIEGPYSNSYFSPWQSITVLDGGSTKRGNTGGSYGIGKNAPYAASTLRAVFYRTYNKDNEWAYQGISRFVSFKDDQNFTTSGFGYYGNDNQKPINNIPELDDITKRTKYGSDVFVFGFCGDNNWKTDIVKAILINFVISIYEEKLKVYVDDIEISKNTLNVLINEYVKNNKRELMNCYSTYQVLTSQNTEVFYKDFHEMGKLELKVLIDPNLNLDKKCLRTRETGMKLFNQGKISKSIPFAAILSLRGEVLGKYFLKLEPPTHDSWDVDRAPNKAQAEQYIDEIQKWEKEIIIKKGAKTSFGDISVSGLSQNLAINGGYSSSKKIDALSETVNDIYIVQKQNNKIQGQFIGLDGDSNNTGKEKIVNGNIDDENGELIGIRKLKGKRERNKVVKHKARLDENGNDLVKKNEQSGKPQNISSLRIIKCDMKKYELIFALDKDILNGHLCLLSIGENNRGRMINVVKADPISNININGIKNGEISFSNVKKDDKVKLSFELSNNSNFAMEVIVYEHYK